MAKKQKTCFIVCRYFLKRTGAIICLVRNEAGVEYITTVHANGRTSCGCMAHTTCYHVKHVLEQEAARPASQKQIPSCQLVRSANPPAQARALVGAAPVGISRGSVVNRGSLSSNRGFQLMK